MKGSLSEIEKGYIEVKRGVLNVTEIAKILGRRVKTVQTYLDSLPPLETHPEAPQATTQPITDYASKGVAVMTEAQSMRADEVKKRSVYQNPAVVPAKR